MFLTYFSGSTPISCGTRLVSTNAYILGKDLLEVEKCAVFWWQGNFMNRLINRSWGEGFVKISLDLSRHIFRFSSSTIVCALEERLKGTFRKMLKKSASLSCSCGLFGLSGVFGCMRRTRQTGLTPDVRTIKVLACQHSFSAAC